MGITNPRHNLTAIIIRYHALTKALAIISADQIYLVRLRLKKLPGMGGDMPGNLREETTMSVLQEGLGPVDFVVEDTPNTNKCLCLLFTILNLKHE